MKLNKKQKFILWIFLLTVLWTCILNVPWIGISDNEVFFLREHTYTPIWSQPRIGGVFIDWDRILCKLLGCSIITVIGLFLFKDSVKN